MKNKMSYKAKRNIIILAIIVALVALASVGTYLFVSGNDETQALSQMNATGENRSGEEVEQSESQTQRNNEGNGEETVNNRDETAEEPNEDSTEPNNNDNNDEDNSVSNNNENNTNNNGVRDNNSNNNNTQTQTVNYTERVESTETLVGYETAGLRADVEGINANIANLEATIEAVTETNNVLVSKGKTITYNITINGDEAVQGINVSAGIPEGTEFVEASDEGILNEGMVSWKVDVDEEKVISFTVNVTKAEGDIVASAVVNGKTTNNVTNTVDSIAPVIEILSEVKEVDGVKYVNAEDPQLKITDAHAFSTVVLNSKGEEVATAEAEEPNADFNINTYYDTFGIGWLGENTFTVLATDVAGNVAKVTFIVDRTAPELEIENINEAGYVNTQGARNVNVKDNNAFTTVILNEAGEVVNTREAKKAEDGTYFDRFNIEWLGEGTFTIKVTDVAGNVIEKTVTVDVTAPEISGLDDGEYVNRNEIVTIKDSNLDTITINGEEQEFEGTSFQDKLTHEGKYVIVAIDKAGNKTEKTVTIDKTAPEISGLDDGEYVNRNEIVTIKDNNLDTITINGEEQEFEGTSFQDKLTHEGKYVIVAIDKAGNVTEKTVTVDKTAPEVEIENINEAGYVNTQGARNVNVKDNNAFTTVILNEAEEVVNTREAQEAENGTYFDRFNIEWLGEGTFTIKVTDVAGNVTEKTVTVDVTAPKFTNVVNGKVYVHEVSPRIEEANIAKAVITRPNGVTEEYNIGDNGIGEAVSANGEYKITVTDRAGNSATVKFIIDTAAPEPTFDYSNRADDGTYFTTKENITVTLTVNEKLKSIPEGWTKVDDYTYTIEHKENGTYTVVLEDLYGNTTEVEYKVQKIDRTPPVITVDTDMTFEAGVDTLSYPEKGRVEDDFDGVIKENNLSGVDIVWYYMTEDGKKGKKVEEFSNGELWDTGLTSLPLGKYYIEYSIEDSAGNRGMTTKILTLQDTKGPTIKFEKEITMESGKDVLDIDQYYANGSVVDNYFGKMNFSDVNTVWYYMTEDGQKGEMVQEFSDGKLWGTTLKDLPLGKYYIEYYLDDELGNRGIAHSILTLKDTIAPEIELNGATSQTIVVGSGDEYEELGATANDLRDGEIEVTSDNIRIDWFGDDGTTKWSVNAKDMTYDKSGHYNVIYKVSDANGNTKEVTRYVYVVEPTE